MFTNISRSESEKNPNREMVAGRVEMSKEKLKINITQ